MNDFLRNGKRIVFCFSLVVAILFGTRSMGHAQSLATVTDAETLVEVLNAYAPDAAYVSNPGEVTISQFGLPLNGAEIVFSLDEPLRILQNEATLSGMNMRLEKGTLSFYLNMDNAQSWDQCDITVGSSSKLVVDGEVEITNLINNVSIDIQGGEASIQNVELGNATTITISENSDVTVNNLTLSGQIILNGGTLKGSLDVSDNGIRVNKGVANLYDGSIWPSRSIVIQGEEAIVNIIGGYYSNLEDNGIILESGTLNVSGGTIGASLRGGSFNFSGGIAENLTVEQPCDIQLSGGIFPLTPIKFSPAVPLPNSETLLAEGYSYFFQNTSSHMTYPSGKHLEPQSIQVGERTLMSYSNLTFVAPEDMAIKETPALVAARKADVGPNGSDVKINGNQMDIYTPEGLAWFAFITNDQTGIQNGQKYFENAKTMSVSLKNDLDMNGYGENWPSISMLNGSSFDGEGHRLYNMDIVSPSPNPFQRVDKLYNLTVEGDMEMINSEPEFFYGGNMAGLTNSTCSQESVILNCAFKGTLLNKSDGYSVSGLVSHLNGRLENCYVNPCGEIIGGDFIEAGPTSVSGLACSSNGTIENCYFGGTIVANNLADQPFGVMQSNTVSFNSGAIVNCYTASSVSLDILNENVRAHVPVNADDPAWKEWSADPDYQCGMPYLFAYGEGTDVANETIEADGSRVFTSGGQIIVMTSRPQTVRVIAMSGAVIASERITGQKAFAGITPGNYIVVVGEKVLKIHL